MRLPEDWDDEGSPRYERETWERALKFVLWNAVELWRKERVRVEPPAIRNGPEESIDIHWNFPGVELLVNVPSASDHPATFYGLNKSGRTEIRGNLDISVSNEWLLMWITALDLRRAGEAYLREWQELGARIREDAVDPRSLVEILEADRASRG